jgi:hypothetical protein
LQEVFGGNAVSDEYHIGRHVANLFVTQTYEGQSDIHGKLEQNIPRSHIVLNQIQLLFSDAQSQVFKLSVRMTCLARSQAPNPVEEQTDAFLLCKIAKIEHTKQTVYKATSSFGEVHLPEDDLKSNARCRAIRATLIGARCARCVSESCFE